MMKEKLLLVDLLARLPYGVKVLIPELRNDVATLIGIDDTCFIVKYDKSIIYCPFNIVIKPYYRSMSSMTEEEKETYHNLCYEEERENFEFGEWVTRVYYHDTIDSIDYLNSIHVDYRGLIEKGLAIEAPEGMYNVNEK